MKVLHKVGSLVKALKKGNRTRTGGCWDQQRRRLEEEVRGLIYDYFPSGSGWDVGTRIDLEKSTETRIVLIGSYHHMDEHGGYCGWTNHNIVFTATLDGFEYSVRVTGKNRNNIKEYLEDIFTSAANTEYK